MKYEALYHEVDERLKALDFFPHGLWKETCKETLCPSWDLELDLKSFRRILTSVHLSCLVASRLWKNDVFCFVSDATRDFGARKAYENVLLDA